METILKMNFGSILHGTNTPNSDIDIKGIFLPDIKQVLLNDIPKSINTSTKKDSSMKNTKDDIDYVMYSLHHFLELAMAGKTEAIDMLHVNDSNILEQNYIWKEIVKNKDKFYTKNLKSLLDYAMTQAKKYGCRGSRIYDIENVLDCLKKYNELTTLGEIWSILPQSEGVKHNIDFYDVYGKMFQRTCKLKYVIDPLQKYLSNYGKKAYLAKNNTGINWKDVSHAIRAALQIKEIFITNNLIYPLKDSKLLLDIKLGKLDYLNVVNPLLEDLIDEVKELSNKSNLPETVDINFWNNFLFNIMNDSIKKFTI